MLRKMMRGKIHRAVITQCDPDYVGSITIDATLLKAVDIRPNESVHVLDIDNGVRFETYVIYGQPGSGIIGINGAAARLVAPGHKVIIISYGMVDDPDVDAHISSVVVCDAKNRIEQSLRHDSKL
jgi:aspartate 1-decarboxylase